MQSTSKFLIRTNKFIKLLSCCLMDYDLTSHRTCQLVIFIYGKYLKGDCTYKILEQLYGNKDKNYVGYHYIKCDWLTPIYNNVCQLIPCKLLFEGCLTIEIETNKKFLTITPNFNIVPGFVNKIYLRIPNWKLFGRSNLVIMLI